MLKRPLSNKLEAFTLIEVLLSLAIAGVIITLAYSLFHGANTTLRGQQERNRVDRSVHEAFLQLERDLMNAVPHQGYPEREFILTQKDEDTVELEFASMQRIPGELDAKWSELMLLRYFVTREGALVRESRLHIGNDEPRQEVLMKNCGFFQISFTGKTPGGPAEINQEDGNLPGGVECTIAHAEDPENPLTARILIPAGQTLMRTPDDSLEDGGSLLRGLP